MGEVFATAGLGPWASSCGGALPAVGAHAVGSAHMRLHQTRRVDAGGEGAPLKHHPEGTWFERGPLAWRDRLDSKSKEHSVCRISHWCAALKRHISYWIYRDIFINSPLSSMIWIYLRCINECYRDCVGDVAYRRFTWGGNSAG